MIRQNVALVLSLALVVLPACSASRARDEILSRQRELQLNGEAWQAARARLWQMCPEPPKDVAEYKRGVAMRAAGQDPFRGCDLRWIKATNAQVINDWQWAWLPAYQTVVTVHEEELRKRVAPKFYEEYMLGLSHYLAQKIDAGEITPEQFMHAFNAGWKWLNGKTNEEQALLQQNHIVAQQSDTAAWNTLSTIAIGLALVASTALLATATVRASQPALQPPPTPVHCRVLSIGGGMAKVNCY